MLLLQRHMLRRQGVVLLLQVIKAPLQVIQPPLQVIQPPLHISKCCSGGSMVLLFLLQGLLHVCQLLQQLVLTRTRSQGVEHCVTLGVCCCCCCVWSALGPLIMHTSARFLQYEKAQMQADTEMACQMGNNEGMRCNMLLLVH